MWDQCYVSVLERIPSYRESNKGSNEKQGPTLGVRFTEVSVKKELTVYIIEYPPPRPSCPHFSLASPTLPSSSRIAPVYSERQT